MDEYIPPVRVFDRLLTQQEAEWLYSFELQHVVPFFEVGPVEEIDSH